MTENKIVANNGSSIVLYTTDDGNTQLEVKLEKDTVWLTQNQMAELFGRDRTVITRHIKNIFKEGELDENITCAKFAHMGADQDQTYETKMYSLDVIISVGYRVKSINGTKFRIWANSILKQYLIRGYAIDQRRLDHYDDLKDVVRLMSRALTLQDKVSEGEYSGLFVLSQIMSMPSTRSTATIIRHWALRRQPKKKFSMPPTKMPWMLSML